MGLDWVFMPGAAVAVALGAMAPTLAFGLAGAAAASFGSAAQRISTKRTLLRQANLQLARREAY
jgi:hypothetical protein